MGARHGRARFAVATRAAQADKNVEACSGGQVLLVANGTMVVSLVGDDMGQGVLVGDGHKALATVQSGVSIVLSSPWAVEWAGMLDTWDLAPSLRLAECGRVCRSIRLHVSGVGPQWGPAVRLPVGRPRPRLWVPAAQACISQPSTGHATGHPHGTCEDSVHCLLELAQPLQVGWHHLVDMVHRGHHEGQATKR